MVQIGDTLTEGGAARVDTHVGTGQTVLRPSALIGALAGIALWVPPTASVAAKTEVKRMRDIAISDLRVLSGLVVVGSLDRDDCP
jgi:hypothetical protein